MNKNIVVTGGAGGLGIEIVKQHLEAGDRVWALDLKKTTDMKILMENTDNEQLYFRECDISSTLQVESAFKELKEMDQKLDVIYSCAGICRPADRVPLTETDLDKIPEVVNINAVGFLRVIKAVFSQIKDGSCIVCVTSEAASIANNHRSGEYSYGMSKVAENMACVILQHYYDEISQDTRVFCLHPGWLKTKMGGGDIADVAPSDSASALIGIARDAGKIPKDHMFIDYQRNRMPW